MGANPQQTLTAFREAEAYPGTSIILAYSHCINMENGLEQQNLAVHSGYWPLIRFNPEVRASGENPFILDSARPGLKLKDFAENELRFRSLRHEPEGSRAHSRRGSGVCSAALDALRRNGKIGGSSRAKANVED